MILGSHGLLKSQVAGDSTFLSFDGFLELVSLYHPVAAVAELSLNRGEAQLLGARGGFDPVARIDFDQKYFDDDKYYRNLDGGVSIPTVMGLSFEAGYERASGDYIAPESTTPDAGLVYAGATLSLGQGLLMDKRRAQLRTAEIYRESTDAERRNLLNELLYDAGKTYWDWYFAYLQLEVYEDAYDAALRRLEAVSASASGGERAAVDTLEAGIQVQNRELALRNARMQYLNARTSLGAYFWSDEGQPLMFQVDVVPDRTSRETEFLDGSALANIDTVVAMHPELLQAQYEIEQLEVERRLKKENIKPVLDLKYNAISEPLNGNPFSEYSINNYKWGMTFRMPLLLRKERGELQMTDIKISESAFKLDNRRMMITTKAQQALTTRVETLNQIELYSGTVRDYGDLLEAERTMFEAGESSLFMVNARELGYINSQVQLIKLENQLRKAELEVQYSLGLLN